MPFPEPSPSDLQSPVPNQPSANPFADLIKSQPSAAPQDANPFAGLVSQPSPAPAAPINPNAPSVGNLPVFAGEGGANAPQSFQEAGSNALRNIKELGSTFMASLHSDPKAMQASLESSFGADNVKMKGDKFFIRGDGDKEFRPLSKGLLDGIGNLIATHAQAATFTAGAMATGGMAAALAPEIELGAPLVSRAASSLAQAGAAGAGGGATQAAVSDAAQNAQGLPNAPGIGQSAIDIAKGAGQGLLAGVAGQAVLGPVGAGLGAAGEYLSQPSKFETAQALYDEIGSTFKNSGLTVPKSSQELGEALGGTKEASIETPEDTTIISPSKGAIGDLRDRLSKRVGVFNDSADQAAGDQLFKNDAMLQQNRSRLEGLGYKFREETETIPVMGYDTEGNAIRVDQPITYQKAFYDTTKALPGGETSKANADYLADQYNKLSMSFAKGGMKPSEITNAQQALGNKAMAGEDPVTTRTGGILRQFSYDLSQWQKDVLKQATAKDPVAGKYLSDAIDSAYKEFSSKADPLNNLISRFQNGEASQVADSLIQPNNVQQVRQLHYLLANENPELWSQVKGNWMKNLIIKNSDQGILDAKSLSNDLFGGVGSKGHEPEILSLMMPDVEQANLKTSLNALANIDQSKFTNNTDRQKFLQQATLALVSPFGKYYHAAQAMRFVGGALAKNGPAADYMATEGLLQLASEAKDPIEKVGLAQAADTLKDQLASMEKVPDKKLGYKYISPVVGRGIMSLMPSQNENVNSAPMGSALRSMPAPRAPSGPPQSFGSIFGSGQ